ncbi:hypothetical protein R3P38DRAFT_3170687 [Favolaschia claudopus]|uniref:DRBM domain-containing protein n=1 Tax=Favolaschia claudopus TaxID=2862362 RepID=A0AAW0DVW1_9AGAR
MPEDSDSDKACPSTPASVDPTSDQPPHGSNESFKSLTSNLSLLKFVHLLLSPERVDEKEMPNSVQEDASVEEEAFDALNESDQTEEIRQEEVPSPQADDLDQRDRDPSPNSDNLDQRARGPGPGPNISDQRARGPRPEPNNSDQRARVPRARPGKSDQRARVLRPEPDNSDLSARGPRPRPDRSDPIDRLGLDPEVRHGLLPPKLVLENRVTEDGYALKFEDSITGPARRTSVFSINGNEIGIGTGDTRRAARKDAVRGALQALGI